jgi:fatty-acyl-CoA synthase
MLNLAAIHEAIAAVAPDRECLVFRDRRFSWSQTTDRTRRLASLLRAHGLGCRRERSELQNWESGQDHVALYLYNGNEYLEGMLGSFKARCAPFNVNYRYVEEELLYLFDNADAKAVVYHASFAPTLAHLRERLPQVRLWLQVADESGEALLPGALDYEQALADAKPDVPEGLSGDDLYILYTGGTTGMPKGVLWRQEDIFLAAMGGPVPPKTLAEAVERGRAGGLRSLPAPPFMHGAAHWVAFNVWSVGGTIVVQSDTRKLDPDDIWSTIERERVNFLTIVGDAFGRPLVDQLAVKRYDLSKLVLVSSGGAIFTASLKDEFLRALPQVRVLDALGSSETGAQATQFSEQGNKATTGDFAVAPGNVVLKEDLSGLVLPGSDEIGWLAREGHIPLGYYKDAEKTARTFPVVGGKRYSVPGDRAAFDASGKLRLLGRDSVCINSGGEKIFAEEVEHALKHHPDVYDCVVVGTPHPRWGQQVTALVKLREGRRGDEESLRKTAAEHIAAFKLPKLFVFVDEMVRAPSGKADYRWATARALAAIGLVIGAGRQVIPLSGYLSGR